MSKVQSASVRAALASPLSATRIAAQAAITTALANATPTHVKAGKRATGAAVYDIIPFTPTEVAVFQQCMAVERAAYETDNKREAVRLAVKAHFGGNAPSYQAYKALQTACELQCIEAGFTGQMMRKHIAAAVKANWGALPESDSPAAIAKRAQRPGKQSKQAKASTQTAEAFAAGRENALKGEDIESFIARVGITATLAALNRLLEAEDSTKPAAAAVAAIFPMLATA